MPTPAIATTTHSTTANEDDQRVPGAVSSSDMKQNGVNSTPSAPAEEAHEDKRINSECKAENGKNESNNSTSQTCSLQPGKFLKK